MVWCSIRTVWWRARTVRAYYRMDRASLSFLVRTSVDRRRERANHRWVGPSDLRPGLSRSFYIVSNRIRSFSSLFKKSRLYTAYPKFRFLQPLVHQTISKRNWNYKTNHLRTNCYRQLINNWWKNTLKRRDRCSADTPKTRLCTVISCGKFGP